MSLVSITLEQEYEGLRAIVAVRGARAGYNRQDIDDMTHDVVVDILENSLVPTEYEEAIERVMGAWRRVRARRRRGVS